MLSLCILSTTFFMTMMMPINNLLLEVMNMNLMQVSTSMHYNSKLFLSILMVISFSIFLWSKHYMDKTWKTLLFYSSLLMFVSSMIILILSNSLLTVFLGWEGLGLSSFILIIFYQNFMSMKGGLLTFLTNRIGDAVLILCLVYNLHFMSWHFTKLANAYMMLLLLMVATTKSAQWPFTNWLPAAMAAPTPVSSLVHSSTLVTAGLWLMIRFSESSMTILNSSMWLGILTLTLASLTALFEVDVKKIVALSTLSQLGLMFVSLSIGNVTICCFHVLTHALAKANLFLVMGNYLHKAFSNQDNRMLNKGETEFTITLASMISVMSLSGLLFFSGFYSKELMLLNFYLLDNSSLSILLMSLLVGLTLSYCLKLLYTLTYNTSSTNNTIKSLNSTIPLLMLSTSSITMGHYLLNNMFMSFLKMNSMEHLYSLMLGWSLALIMWSSFFYWLFHNQEQILNQLKPSTDWKTLTLKLESNMSESLILVQTLSLTKTQTLNFRNATTMSILVLTIILVL